MKRVKMLGLALGLSLAGVVFGSTPISVEQAKVAVGNFVRRSPRPLGSPASGTVVRAESEKVDGENLFHVVYLSGGGYVVTSADKDISPIMVIGDGDEFEASHRNPVYSMLMNDLQNRSRALKDSTAANASVRKMASVAGSSGRQAQSDEATAWDMLLESAGTAVSSKTSQLNAPRKARQSTPESPIDAPPLTDIRVDKLLKTKWDQSTWGNYSNTRPVYNAFTPASAVCGCVATAMSQVMYYWSYPERSPSRTEDIFYSINGALCQTNEFSGFAYSWNKMLTEFDANPNISKADAALIGCLTLDAGLSVGMKYTTTKNGSSASLWSVPYALLSDFKYVSASLFDVEQHAGEALNEQYEAAIFSNFDARQPVMFAIYKTDDKGEISGGHCVVGDGYGCYSKTYYVHINCGWSGHGDAWYAMPDCRKMNGHDFTLFSGVVYNVNPRESGDIVSGRVLDVSGSPVKDAVVTLQDSQNKTLCSAKSNDKGIYYFRVSRKGSYFLVAKGEDGESKRACVELARNSSVTTLSKDPRTGQWSYLIAAGEPDITYVGNKWGVDLYLQNAEEEKIEEKKVETVAVPAFTPIGGEFEGSQSVSIKCSTWGAEIRYTTDGSEPTASSARYSSQVTLNASTTLKARAFKDGWSPSGTAVAVFTKKVAPPVKLPTPTISPAESRFVGSCTVTLTCSDANATIYYTTDGSVPTVASSKYTKAFTVSQTGDFTVNAIAFRAGNFTMSDVATKTYTVTAKTKIATPALSPASGTFALNTSVSISGDLSLATIHYTTDGSVPNASSPVYSAPIFISGTKTVRAIAIPNDTSKYIASDPVVGKYELDASKTINGALNNSKLVFKVSSDTASAHVSYNDTDEIDLYTCDGSAALRFVVDSDTPTDNVSVSTDVVGPGVLTFWVQQDVTRTVSGKLTTISSSSSMSWWMDGSAAESTVLATTDDSWTQRQVIVPAGTHTLVWKCAYNQYRKRGRGVLDLVEWLTEAELPNVTIAFDANGAGGTPSFASTNGVLGSDVQLAKVGAMAYGNRRFMGWNTSADGKGKWFSGGATHTISSRDDFILYAMWQELVPVYMEVPYDAKSVVFVIPEEFGTKWRVPNSQACDWMEPYYTLRGSNGAFFQLGLGSACYDISSVGRLTFTLELTLKSSNDSPSPRKFEFPIYPDKYVRAPVFTVIQLPDRETDKLADISLSCPPVANAVEGTKITCKTHLRNGKQQVVANGVTWILADVDKAFAEVNAKGEVMAKVPLSAPRTVTVRASCTDAGGYSAAAECAVTLAPDINLETALDAPALAWMAETGADGWHGQTAVSSVGGSSAMAGSAFFGTPRLSTTVIGPGTVRCKCRVVGRKGGGTLWMIVDEGKAVKAKHFCATFLADAPSDWVDVSVPVMGIGAHTLTFVYTAEGTCAEMPDDNAYVDGFSYEPDTTVPYVVEYVSNGKKVGSCNPCWGEVFALAKCPALSGRRFVGWACSNGRRYDDGMLVFNLAQPGETVTMTAIWE